MHTAKTGAKAKTKNLSQVLLVPATYFALAFAIAIGVSFSLFAYQESSQMLSHRADLIGKLFVRSIARSFLEGRDEDVDRSCRQLVQESLIASVRVRRPDGYAVCETGSSDRQVARKWQSEKSFQIFFSQEGSSVAGVATIVFDQSELAYRIGLYLALGSLLSIFFFWAIQVFFRRSIRLIVNPIANIIDVLKTRPIEEIGFGGVIQDSRITELNRLASHFRVFAKRILVYQNKILAHQVSAASSEMAKRTAHDIRSPLSVLNILARKLSFRNAEEQKLFEDTVQRVSGIADGLLNEIRETGLAAPKPAFVEASKTPLVSIVSDLKSVTDEKQIEFAQAAFSFSGEGSLVGLSCTTDGEQFKRLISNFVNNSVEAKASRVGFVWNVDRGESKFNLQIEDNGPGFSAEALQSVGRIEYTSGKVRGNGIGLSEATHMILSWGGDVGFENRAEGGARVTLSLRVDELG